MRENDRIRLGPGERVKLAATVLVECFTPSNIAGLFSAIDLWPIQPSEYREGLKRDIRDWRNSQYGGAWSHVANLARPGVQLFDASRDSTIAKPIKAVELILMSAAPSLTLLVAIFYPDEDEFDLSDRLRDDFAMRVDTSRFTVRGRFARLRALNPWSRAKSASYAINFSVPSHLQREWCREKFDEFDAYCWHWLSKRAFGKFAELPPDQRPSVRVIFTEDIEPFGPIDDEPVVISAGKPLSERDKERMNRRRGPLEALGLNGADHVWTSPQRDGFYFSMERDGSPKSSIQNGIISAQRSAAQRLIDGEGEYSDNAIISNIARDFPDIFRVWATEQLLAKYKDDVSAVRDSSVAPQTALRTAQRLYGFLTSDGHDAAVVAKDVIRIASTDFTYSHLPVFADLNEMRFQELQEDGDAGQIRTLPQHYREALRENAEIVAAELELTTRSIETSAQLLQAVSAIRLQWASLVVAVIAAAIALIAILLT
ncbi:hypothetical protein P6281_10150 [Mycobacterium sp. 5-140-3-2]|uniref:hypothetical protein n=1 Tax=unclassified Mycobacterium TaxID=2642494 RepID=UPI002D77E651|nr:MULTISPECIES: hypothetical protein [unclassified Mycobacterium]WRU84199.1 hypothetical protein P6281_10150 [Mycobacterium sp. 5-140-3-2]WSE39655.1 hypothetical protein QGN28_15965 [Mycobacterium sp. 5-140-3-1]